MPAVQPDALGSTAWCHLINICLIRQLNAGFPTCGKLRQVLLLLGIIPKKQNALKADGLVGTQSDTNTQVMTGNDLNQPGIL